MKKIILFIVEGYNDSVEINTILKTVFKEKINTQYQDVYAIYNGDITTEIPNTEKTIIDELNKFVLSAREGNNSTNTKLYFQDIKEIIHIVDIDGVFIPENSIIQKDDCKVVYSDSTIECFDKNFIVGRNRRKKKILQKLSATTKIDNKPYSIYYVSCNMDHVLFNLRNPSKQEKRTNAMTFKSICNSVEYIKNTFYDTSVNCGNDFANSWAEIQKGYNSLTKHTNMNILLDKLIEEEKQE